MTAADTIARTDLAALRIVRYPDPRLRGECLTIERFDESLRRLTDRMFELMFQARGVGLAAPQVGLPLRLFVASPAFTPDDRQVYANPRIVSVDGWQECEEGCLSVPGVSTKVRRPAEVTIEAMDLEGRPFRRTGTELVARLFQHETDHIDGRTIVDRMGRVARLAHRRTLKELEEGFAERAGG